MRGYAYDEKGDHEKAIADFTEVIRIDPRNALAYSRLGHDYEMKRDHDKAVASYTESIRLDPKLAREVLQPGHGLRGEG